MLASVRERVRNLLLEGIAQGRWRVGELLPSERALAAELGVSRPTVRDALQQLAALGLVERIHGLGTRVISTGSRPSPACAPPNFGFVVPYPAASMWGEIATGFLAELDGSGYETTLKGYHEESWRFRQAVASIIESGAQGVAVMVPRSCSAADIELLRTSPIPVVLMVRHVPELAAHQMVIDNVAVGEQAAAHLLHMGHRRIVHLGQFDYQVGCDRLAGYRTALDRFGVAFDPELVVDLASFPSLAEATATAICTLLARNVRFTAITAFNDLEATHAIHTLQRHGLRVPDDISVIGVDNHPVLRTMRPALSTVAIDWAGFGRWAARRLLDAVTGQRRLQPATVYCPLEVLPRETCSYVTANAVTRRERLELAAE